MSMEEKSHLRGGERVVDLSSPIDSSPLVNGPFVVNVCSTSSDDSDLYNYHNLLASSEASTSDLASNWPPKDEPDKLPAENLRPRAPSLQGNTPRSIEIREKICQQLRQLVGMKLETTADDENEAKSTSNKLSNANMEEIEEQSDCGCGSTSSNTSPTSG